MAPLVQTSQRIEQPKIDPDHAGRDMGRIAEVLQPDDAGRSKVKVTVEVEADVFLTVDAACDG